MGIEEIVADRMDATGMYFSELISILKESIEREIKKIKEKILGYNII